MAADGVVTIIGAGLAGAEAAYQASRLGARVVLYEMRPGTMTPAHKTGKFAELVCSNSLKSNSMDRAGGILKEELRRLGSLILRCADATAVPAGSALAVDRERFADMVTATIESDPNIEIRREEVTAVPSEGMTILASGPLTSQPLARSLFSITGQKYLFFYDAISPIVDADSIDRDKVFLASRYGKGEAAYINCPMSEEQYNEFYDALMAAEISLHADVDPNELFEGCLPVEVIASRGHEALRFGPMKPVGLIDPRTGHQPFAVVQLRAENQELTMYNLVGFQTSLKWGEQARVFRMIPGLENAEFLRYGQVHRNTYVNAPTLLKPTFQFRSRDDLFCAGQLTGVEGYMESTGAGLISGINAARMLSGQEPIALPRETVMGALAYHICNADPESFQPMNANFGVLPPADGPRKMRKSQKKELRGRACLEALDEFIRQTGLQVG
ncbi:MAG: methylenetetrahydrofolate--tRNA-(uracil(54)-C(5))-methyltransferase (FADH(2)-oxidizing) TrmFO [Armatimonadetes bacterium]|nr:methylenetetrahydrofolate--tRNA-(uracil(54)-C(5))-methyltransferase (FADH(2)-oxidizing) TrmFO [Armatimonadota bacterium]